MSRIFFQINDDKVIGRVGKEKFYFSPHDFINIIDNLERQGIYGKEILINDKKTYVLDGLEFVRYAKIDENKNYRLKRKESNIFKKIVTRVVSFSLVGALAITGIGALRKVNSSNKMSVNTISTSYTYVNSDPLKGENKDAVSYVRPAFEYSFEDRSYTDKAVLARESYFDIYSKYGKIYGIDPNLMLAIGTQERGVHSSTESSGGGIGLNQIQVSVWAGKSLTAYNFEIGDYETITVDGNKLGELGYNIKIATMIFSNNLRYYDYNIIVALQAYNYGSGNMNKVFKAYEEASEVSKESVISDMYNNEWLNYRSVVNGGDLRKGDHLYIEHVLSYINSDPSVIKIIKPNLEVVTLYIKNVYENTMIKSK